MSTWASCYGASGYTFLTYSPGAPRCLTLLSCYSDDDILRGAASTGWWPAARGIKAGAEVGSYKFLDLKSADDMPAWRVTRTISRTTWLHLSRWRLFVGVWKRFCSRSHCLTSSWTSPIVHSSPSMDPEVIYITRTIFKIFDWLIDWWLIDWLIDLLTEYDDCDESDFELHWMLRHRLMDDKNRTREPGKTSVTYLQRFCFGTDGHRRESKRTNVWRW